jgi:serine/threonine-protein kinase HipA
MTDTARVILWGSDIGAVTWLAERGIGVFQYTPEFARSGIEVAPIMAPLSTTPYTFPSLSKETFKGLPGLLADSLPDTYGNALIDAWLAGQGRQSGSFTPVERLCYTGSRGMGALEFKPLLTEAPRKDRKVKIDALVKLANTVLDDRTAIAGRLGSSHDHQVMEDILRVGTSAGGARAKAVLAWNEHTGDFRSGQAPAARGYSHWIVKFDGVSKSGDRGIADPRGYGRIEYAYHLMARFAGIVMEDCRLHEEGGRAHFMTRRFDRTSDGQKRHMQSLGAMMHFDYNSAGAHSYEQAIQTIRQLDLSAQDVEQQVRRAFFNILARNQDDHVKNIAFLMERDGRWRLSPAFDVTYAYDPTNQWMRQHQMTLNEKSDGFVIEDLIAFAENSGLKRAKAMALISQITDALSAWFNFADQAGIPEDDAARVARGFRQSDSM